MRLIAVYSKVLEDFEKWVLDVRKTSTIALSSEMRVCWLFPADLTQRIS